jgi:hypothetical protein
MPALPAAWDDFERGRNGGRDHVGSGGDMTSIGTRLGGMLLAATTLAGCAATHYQLALMPRNSGKVYTGEAVQPANGNEARVTIAIEDKVYNGTWLETAPDRSTGFVTGGFGFGGRRGGVGLGSSVVVDNPEGGAAKALLQSADGAGLRCDFRGLATSRSGGGTCQDDQGIVFDVQIRLKESP